MLRQRWISIKTNVQKSCRTEGLPRGPFDFQSPLISVGSPRRQSRHPRPRRVGPPDQLGPPPAAPPPAPPPVLPPVTPKPTAPLPTAAPVPGPEALPPAAPKVLLAPLPAVPPPGPGVLGEPACGCPWPPAAPPPPCGNGNPAAFFIQSSVKNQHTPIKLLLYTFWVSIFGIAFVSKEQVKKRAVTTVYTSDDFYDSWCWLIFDLIIGYEI